jgi:hypothetical protein
VTAATTKGSAMVAWIEEVLQTKLSAALKSGTYNSHLSPDRGTVAKTTQISNPLKIHLTDERQIQITNVSKYAFKLNAVLTTCSSRVDSSLHTKTS